MPRFKFWFPRFDENQEREAAVKIQAWWKHMLEVRAAKKPLKQIFEGDVTGLTGLRCMVLIGAHDDVLGPWARAMMQRGPDAMLAQAFGEDSTSWLVLMRKAAMLLVLSLSCVPESPNASLYLGVLTVLLSNKCAVATSSDQGSAFCQAITAYLMKQGLYYRLRRSISRLPVENSTSLASFLDLCMLPLSTYPESSSQFTQIYIKNFIQILGLPLLPNRLPPDRSSTFISYFLFTNPDILTPRITVISDYHITARSSIDLAANMFMFVSPHYERLSAEAFASYVQLSAMLISKFTDYSLNPPSSSGSSGEAEPEANSVGYDSYFGSDGHTDYEDSDLDDEDYRPPLEATNESVRWIEQVASPEHITKLINLTQSQATVLPHLAVYLYTVTDTWPSSEQDIHNIILAKSSGWLVGDLYRNVVRRLPLGQEEDSTNVYGSASAVHWPPIILLADLYYKLLHTMDDEEFLNKTPGIPRSNPLTLVEAASFSVQLLNIVFTLYWHSSDDLIEPGETQSVWGIWEKALREKLLRCLLRIYARDSRRPFVLPSHWLLRSQLDMNLFIDAAVMEGDDYFDRLPRRRSEISRNHRYSMQPRLAILKKIPFAIPFEVRVSAFQHLIANHRVLYGSTERLNALGYDQRLRVKIHRGAVARNGFGRLRRVDLKAPLEVVMTDQFEQEEEWIDEGGHFKEFFTSFCQQVFATNSSLWLKDNWGGLYPTTHGYATEAQMLDWYRFFGSIIGKAIYEGILIRPIFANLFLSKWLGKRSTLDDLFALDPDLYRHLLTIKHSTEDIKDLSLYFTITVEDNGVTKAVDLIPNGQHIAVTTENRLRYIDLVARYRLNAQIKRQSKAFLRGLSQLIRPSWLKMFNQAELQILIGGATGPIDLDDLRRHTTYQGNYHNHHETIIVFWRVVNSFHSWQKQALLGFVTSCSRPHALGFKELVPNFSIRDTGSDETRLPTSSTCVNLLRLPAYKSERQLREMLLEAISSRAGFDSS